MFSKNGSIPKPETDGTEGWIEVPDEPACPDGKEVVWWYPPGWVIRDPKPEGNWSWSQSEERWVEYQAPSDQIEVAEPAPALESSQVIAMTSEQIGGLSP